MYLVKLIGTGNCTFTHSPLYPDKLKEPVYVPAGVPPYVYDCCVHPWLVPLNILNLLWFTESYSEEELTIYVPFP